MNIGKNLSNFLKFGCLDKVSRGFTQEKRRRRADTWRSTSQLAVLRRSRWSTTCIMTPNTYLVQTRAYKMPVRAQTAKSRRFSLLLK